MVERAAHNGFVVGSNPARPKKFYFKFKLLYTKMYFNLKNYQVLKLKNYFKNKSLFVIFHCAKLNLKGWIKTEQKLKKLNLKYYKPLNKVTLKNLKNSVYSNYSSIINGFILFVSFETNKKDSNETLHNLNELEKNLKPLFINVSLKLNNKFYSPKQLEKLQSLNYKDNMFKLHKVLNKSLKTSFVLTQIPKSK